MKKGKPPFSEYGLIGKTLTHSFSQKYFTKKFTEENINSKYNLFELESILKFPELIKNRPHLRGLNVTIPYKQAVLPYLDHFSEIAKATQAVNTIVFEDDGTLSGHNTDVSGFLYSLQQEISLKKINSALILGTGGAAKAVTYALQTKGVENITHISRWSKRKLFSFPNMNYTQLNALVDLKGFDLILNTTPVGTYPDSEKYPHFPYHLLGKKHIVFDLIYNPDKTLFLQKAEAQGSQVINGLGMLHAQAEKAWEIWTKVVAPF